MSASLSRGQHARKTVEHARGRAPDVAALVGNRHVVTMAPTEAVLAPLITRGIGEMRERRFEHRRDFERVERELERRLDPSDDRRDPETGWNLVQRQAPEHADA